MLDDRVGFSVHFLNKLISFTNIFLMSSIFYWMYKNEINSYLKEWTKMNVPRDAASSFLFNSYTNEDK